jgi:ribosome biogenesis SPOUT family RNA methylase Rps3
MIVIEHLEPELFPWCILEYKHISEITGKDVMFSNISQKDLSKLKGLGIVKRESVKAMKLKNACILDPFAKIPLSSKDKFDFVILGGILGDEPMKRRTEIELDMDMPRRNLGKAQMSTDTAVYVAKHILVAGRMEDLKFQDEIEIELDDGESMILPYRYVLIDGKPMLPKGLIELLKKGF